MHEHTENCLVAGVSIHGTNAEVMLGQWEYQVFGRGAKKSADNAWMARYILYRTAEKYDVDVDISPKPIKGDWNGNGMHTNFSNIKMRELGGEDYIKSICDLFSSHHDEHIAEYGSKNDERLTGLHETQHISKFSYGVSDRGASIRIPMALTQNSWKGYLEDRRPAGNADPYKVTNRILTTMER
jgi:glutamine synthetase